MSLLLAPYNDSMRLGMGFNSYTQTMCIDGAVEVKNENKVNVENLSQVVTYSSKFVERLSDIVSSMNISYSAAIKKGTIEVSGNGNSIDEDKIKASDINLVVSVQVINQTTCLKDSAEFKALDGVLPGSPAFNDAFGDCYISGFIEGGDFSSIISMRCLDRSRTASVICSIKKLAKTSEPEGFSLDSYSLSNNLSGSSVLKDTELTVSVNWMGGGQIKDPKTNWDITSVYEAAASFPSDVAKSPQRTWAILTKYKANRSFNKWATALSLRPLEYDSVIFYTEELFNNFMEYKQLIKKVQDIISHGDNYTVVLKPKAIPIHIGTLVAVRNALRNEMNKIVSVVNVLSRRPELLSQANSFNIVPKNELVREIVDNAISNPSEPKIIVDGSESGSGPENAPQATETGKSAGDFQEIEHSEAAQDSSTGEADQVSTPKQIQKPQAPTSMSTEATKIDLSTLIAPEVFADLLPVRTGGDSIDQEDASANAAAVALFPPAPKDDADALLSSRESNKLKILAAVCGIQDATQTLQDRVKDETSLTIPINEIDRLVDSTTYSRLRQPFIKTLSFVYQYGNGAMRICSANFDKDSTDCIQITPNSGDTVIVARPWTKESWSLLTAVYGGKVFNDEEHLRGLENEIRKEFNADVSGNRRVHINNEMMDTDPWPNVVKTGILFFKSTTDGPVRATVAVEGQDCLITDQPQLAELSLEVVKEVVKEVGTQVNVIRGGPCGRYSCTYDPGTFSVDPSEEPFLRFDNGVGFKYQPDGNFVVYRVDGSFAWASAQYGDKAGRSLQFQADGNLVAYGDRQTIMWSTGTMGNYAGRLVLSNTNPFIEVFRNDDVRLFSNS